MLKLQHKKRKKITIQGAVQGVGFRPFVYRLAHEMNLSGWVRNDAGGVFIEVQGTPEMLHNFEEKLQRDIPPAAVIHHYESVPMPAQNDAGFCIIKSEKSTEISAAILPDLATCPDCLREMNDPTNRRHQYPFINCTNCGPRYTIIKALPYDRPNTTMAGFELCEKCRAEYEAPLDRRFHAQPVACPHCGPKLSLPLQDVAQTVREGKIIALKGLGGFHLICDARDEEAVQLLRERKHRKSKPFAVMMSTIEDIKDFCEVSEQEEELLKSSAAPIVLLRCHPERSEGSQKDSSPSAQNDIAWNVAPDNPNLGVMLPSTPLHHLLLQELGFPIVATSGNRHNEPICITDDEARESLSGIADLILTHNRPIAARADDSIVRVMAGEPCVLRRGRGYAPMPLLLPGTAPSPILATGAHLKNTVALAIGKRLVLSPHIGDLDTAEARTAHKQAIDTLCTRYETMPEIIAHDMHPDYASTPEPSSRNIPVQHHYAHALACMLENDVPAPCLAFAWDGTGYGEGGTIWGGEVLTITEDHYERIAHLLPFPLPGGDKAAKEPRRAAMGLLYAMGEVEKIDDPLILQALEKNINTPLTSSMGRLFDAVAYLAGLADENSFEGEAAMALEFVVDPQESGTYSFELKENIIDWRPIIRVILSEAKNLGRYLSPAAQDDRRRMAAKFHNTLAEIIVHIADNQPHKNILLTGGCFQNKTLLETSVIKLKEAGFVPHWHRHLPCNDGGIAAGQIMAALRRMK